jgi:predicted O-methyltransferase YrrM
LPERSFDVIALTDIRPGRELVVLENVVRALRAGGVLVCGSTWSSGRALTQRFDQVQKYGVGPWRVIEARGERADRA